MSSEPESPAGRCIEGLTTTEHGRWMTGQGVYIDNTDTVRSRCAGLGATQLRNRTRPHRRKPGVGAAAVNDGVRPRRLWHWGAIAVLGATAWANPGGTIEAIVVTLDAIGSTVGGSDGT